MHVTLDDGTVLRLHLRDSRRRWNRAYQAAMRRDTLLELEGSNGEVIGINPRDIRCVRFEARPAPARPRQNRTQSVTRRPEDRPARRVARARRLDLARDREAVTEAVPYDFLSD